MRVNGSFVVICPCNGLPGVLNGVSIIKQCNISKGMGTCLIKCGAPLSFHLHLIRNDFVYIF